MTIALTNRDLASVRQLLLAAPDADDRVLPREAAMALARLVPCDAIGAAEVDGAPPPPTSPCSRA